MKLTNEQQIFLSKRKRWVRYFPVVGIALMVISLGMLGWLFISMPLFANPFEVAARINSGTILASHVVIMAAMLPVVVLLCFLLVIVVVILLFLAFSKEKVYQRIIDSLLTPQDYGD